MNTEVSKYTTLVAQDSTKIEELESIRGLAALLVVIFHLPKWNPLLDIGFVNNGYLMVELFFVLSGFVIFNAYAEKIKDKNDLLRFQFLRFGRLYPVHIVFLLAFLAIELAKFVASTTLGINSPNSIPFETNDLSAFIKNIFLISSVLPDQPTTFNVPAWSISVEFYTYFVFALSILAFKINKNIIFSVFAAISIAMLSTENTFGFEPLLRCFAGFFIGCLTARLTGKRAPEWSKFLSLIVFLAIVIFLQIKPTKELDVLIYFLTAALIASIVLSSNGWLKKMLNFRAFTWLGTISYSVYMSHAAIEWIVNQVIRVVLKKPETIGALGKSVPQLTRNEALLACLVVVVAVLIVSAFVYTFIEKPMREKSRRYASKKMRHSTAAFISATRKSI